MAGNSSAVAKPSTASGAQKRGGGGDSSTTASELVSVRSFLAVPCFSLLSGVTAFGIEQMKQMNLTLTDVYRQKHKAKSNS